MSQVTKQRIVSELDILRNISTEWLKLKKERQIQKNACILSANFAHKMLDVAGLPHLVRPVGVTVFNRRGWELFGTPLKSLPPEAWNVHCSSLVPDDPNNHGFSGHVVIETRRFFLDLTADIFSRPKHGIVLTKPLIVPMKDIHVCNREKNELEFHRTMKVDEFRRFSFPSMAQYTYYYEDDNTSYKKAPDWAVSFQDVGVDWRNMRLTKTPHL